jgi:hypothetical protein
VIANELSAGFQRNEDALIWCVVGPELPTSVYLVGWVPMPTS